MPVPNYKHRYRTDPAFRAKEIQRIKRTHIANSTSPVYLELVRQRKMRWSHKNSIWVHEQAIERLKRKIRGKDRLIEELELAWGKERSIRKSSGPQAAQGPSL